MGMAFGLEKKLCSENNLQIAKNMVPKALEPYVIGMNYKDYKWDSCGFDTAPGK